MLAWTLTRYKKHIGTKTADVPVESSERFSSRIKGGDPSAEIAKHFFV